MAKKWLKFDCKNCNETNWLHEDIAEIVKERTIAYCIYCGYVYGYPEKEDQIDAGNSWLKCIPMQGIGVKQTRGPISPGNMMTAQTRWVTSDASDPKEGLDRASYMLKFGFDPWTNFCSKKDNSDKPICQNDGSGRSYKDRLKTGAAPKVDGEPLK